MFSLIVCTHMTVCIILLCRIPALPFFLIAGVFCLLIGRPFNDVNKLTCEEIVEQTDNLDCEFDARKRERRYPFRLTSAKPT